jgi:hypothetical protein
VADGVYVSSLRFMERKKKMTQVLRTSKGHWKRLSLYSSKLCIFRPLLMFLISRLVIVIFLFFLLILARCFFLYTSCVLLVYLGSPYAFNDICQLLAGKKNDSSKLNP